jgi:hypothetical protein
MAWDVTKMLIDTVEKYNGVITILWHNTHAVKIGLDTHQQNNRIFTSKLQTD